MSTSSKHTHTYVQPNIPIHTCTTDEGSHEEWLLPNEEVHSREVGEEHVQDDKEECTQPVWWARASRQSGTAVGITHT